MKNNREYRNLILEVRDTNEEEYIVEGYACTFNEPYTLWKFDDKEVREQVDRHAFDWCDMTDVIFQYNHEGRVFARNKNNTLDITIDDKGLFIKADLGGTEEGRKLYNEIKGGYTDKMSFGFVVEEDKVEDVEDKVYLRTITKIRKLYDVSAVSIPANDATSISARKFCDGVIAEKEAERLLKAQKEQRIKRLKLQLELAKEN